MELGESKWSAVFGHAIVIERPRGWRGFGWVFGPLWRGVGLQHTRGLYGSPINRGSMKRTPNGTKLDRRSTGSVPRPLEKSRSTPRMFNTRTRKETKGGVGGRRSVGSQNEQRGKCSDALDEHICKRDAHDDMICNA